MATQRARIQIIAAEAGVAPRARAIWNAHPLLKIMTASAVLHFDKVPLGTGSNSLVHVAIKESVVWFDNAQRGEATVDAAPSTHYLASLLHVFSHALLFKVKRGASTWDPAAQYWATFIATASSPKGAVEVIAVRPTRALREDAFRKVCSMFSIDADEVLPLVHQFRPLRISTRK